MLESALDYHRREDKPFWWGHFDRLLREPDEWADTKDVLVADTCEVIVDWGPPASRGTSGAPSE